jgi:hypothetical protein
MIQIPSEANKFQKRMTIALVLVVVSAIAIALATASSSHDAGAASAEASFPTLTPIEAPSVTLADAPEGSVIGDVLETLPVSKYTYLRLRSGGAEIWAAVPSANVAIGNRVSISSATRMDDFKSVTLGRTFKVIYFGTLGDVSVPSPAEASSPKFPLGDEQEVDPDQELPPGHPEIGNSAPISALAGSNQLPPGHPGIASGTTSEPSPHGGTGDSPGGSAAPPLSVPTLERAPGGRLIAELVIARYQLDGKRVRVRGQVTKVTPDVQGRAFFHLRDAETSAAGPAVDLVVTSVVAPVRGQVAVFEGTLRADDDIGIGYKYPVLLEDASVVDH